MMKLIRKKQAKQAKLEPRDPPDGGWGWVVVVGCNLMLQCTVIIRSVGVFFNDLRDYFGASATAVGSIPSVHMATFLFMGPLGGYLCRRLGPRPVTILSGVVAFLSLSIASQAQSLAVLVLFFGGLAGIFLGFTYVSAVAITNTYFKKRFAIANSIANSGLGLAVIIFPILARFLINLYNWNGALLVIAAVIANICVCGMLFRPLRPSLKARPTYKNVNCEERHDLSMDIEGEEWTQLQEGNSERSSHMQGQELSHQKLPEAHGKPHRKVSLSSGCDSDGEERDHSLKAVPDGKNYGKISTSSGCDSCVKENDQNSRDAPDEEKSSRRISVNPGYNSDAKEDDKKRRQSRGSIYLRNFARGSGLYLIKSRYRFNLLCLMQITLGTSFSSVIIHFVPLTIYAGISKLDAAFLLSISGIGSLVGRLASGPLVDCKILSALKLYFLVVLTCGIAIIVCPAISSYAGFIVFAVVFGVASGIFKSLHVVLIRIFVGADHLSSAIGISMPFVGIGNVLGPIFVGWLYDIRGQYNLAFYVTGSALSLGAFLLLLMPYLGRLEKRRHPDAPDKVEDATVTIPMGSVQSLSTV